MQRKKVSYVINPHNKENRHPDSQCLRQFMMSPQRKKVDYNTYMLGQKKHRKVEQSRIETSLNQTVMGSYRQNTSVRPDSSYMCEVLTRQNEYLVNQLMLQKEKQKAYQSKIRKLKKAKSEENLLPQETSKYIRIRDKQIQESRMSSLNQENSKEVNMLSSVATIRTLEDEHDTLESLLVNSDEYIRHTRQNLSNELQILGEKLCRLLHQTSEEPSFQLKQTKRKEMFRCVQQLRQLKKEYNRHFPAE